MDHYRQHALAYAQATRDVDMRSLYPRFLQWVPERGRVLDAGCGSGRDTLAFQRAGYEVAAFDASPELAQLASEHTGVAVRVADFLNLSDATPLGVPAGIRFDGIWACASLLHVAEADQAQVWMRLWAWLAPGGVVYASYKLGDDAQPAERVDSLGRPFTDATDQRLRAWLTSLPGLAHVHTWVSADQRQGESQIWLNAIVRRESVA